MRLSKIVNCFFVIFIDHILPISQFDKSVTKCWVNFENPFKVYNACGKFSINESADLVRQAKLVISHDTGLMHIAAAFRKPVISVWGNTVPEFGMYPYFGQSDLQQMKPFDIVEINGLACRPCSKIGYEKCPKGHFKCMEQIDPAHIRKLVQKILNSK